jgi:hypothetical protein
MVDKNLDLIPDHNTETAFAERLLVPLEERRIVKWLLAPLYNNQHGSGHSGSGRGKRKLYRANETLPTPLSAKRLDGPHPISNALLALLTLWHSQPYMTVLAIRVPIVHCESNVRIFEDSVSREAPVAGCRGGRGKEGISTLCTEEMLFVVGPGA